MKVYHRPPERSIGFAMPNYLETIYQSNFERIAPPPPCAVVAALSVTAETVERADTRGSEADDDAAAAN